MKQRLLGKAILGQGQGGGVGHQADFAAPPYYLIRDEFTTDRAAGAVNGTAAEPGPGARTTVNANAKLSISGGKAVFATGGAVGDPRLLYDRFVDAVTGRLCLIAITYTAGGFDVGTDNDLISGVYFGMRASGTGLSVRLAGVVLAVGAVATGNTYQLAVANRAVGAAIFIKGGAFTNWTLLYIADTGGGPFVPAAQAINNSSSFSIDNVIVPAVKWLPSPLVSDGFSVAGSSDGLGHAEGIAGGLGSGGGGVVWAGATATIVAGKLRHVVGVGAELLTNGNMETGSPPTSWTSVRSGILDTVGERTGGAGAQALLVNKGALTFPGAKQDIALDTGDWFAVTCWAKSHTGTERLRTFVGLRNDINTVYASNSASYLAVAAWSQFRFNGRTGGLAEFRILSFDSDGSINLDDASVKALTLATLFRTTSTGVASVLASVAVTLTTGTQAGLVLNLDSAATPANFVIAYHDGTTCRLEKCVAGTYTSLISVTTTYVAGARIAVQRRGNAVRLYYNNALVGTEQTVSDAGIVGNTLHGTFSAYELNEFDDFVCYDSGVGGAYDAVLDAI